MGTGTDATDELTDRQFLALHALAVKKAGTAAAVAAILGDDAEQIEHRLAELAQVGEVCGARGTWMVAPSGRDHLDRTYAVRYAALRQSGQADAAYARFERINREVLAVFTDWQSVSLEGERVPNDHADGEYDAGVLNRLGNQHDRVQKVLTVFEGLEPRLGVYRDRLESAYDNVICGQFDYVSGVRVDSYHTVWFELHEDLLRLLGRTREDV